MLFRNCPIHIPHNLPSHVWKLNFASVIETQSGSISFQALVLRTIASVANYDYIHDVIFYQNGVVEVKVTASGYPMGSFYDNNVAPYAYQIHTNLSSNVHDHLINYKVDLDVGGRENSYETIEVQTENVTDQWMPEKNRYNNA